MFAGNVDQSFEWDCNELGDEELCNSHKVASQAGEPRPDDVVRISNAVKQ